MKRGISKVALIIIAIVVIIVCIGGFYIAKKRVLEDDTISTEVLYTAAKCPTVDAAIELQPLMDAILTDFTGEDKSKIITNYSDNDEAYIKLINNEVDLILAKEPSENVITLAKEKGVELEQTPVVKDALVFLVNWQNSVTSLNSEQIQEIYKGNIKNWGEVDGDSKNVTPYHNAQAEQGMKSMVMKENNLMNAKAENQFENTLEMMKSISEKNVNAIGYSFYYSTISNYESIDKALASTIRYLDVNGITPEKDAIQNGTYPYTKDYYIVVNKNDYDYETSKVLLKQITSARGKYITEEAGFIPVK